MPRDNVVSLISHSLNDIPALMREAADAIERGERGNVTSAAAVLLNDDGTHTVFGWGRTDAVHSIGLLHIGATWLATNLAERA